MAIHDSFELQREENIPDINARAWYYTHKQTGARVLSVAADDVNKVFGITFRTPPEDSTGIAHIMEHSVLCGSRKYPVKEPFVELLKGSLYTFLNAFTYPDKTCYPVASTNLQDFYNLIDVYLDAVFYPRITPQVLQQEGWHYELDKPEDPLTYKGVVFNEMKGAYSSPGRVISQTATSSLFPDNTYFVDSGGDPRRIPDLSFEQFRQFHQTYYHPSNAFIYFYGDDDPEKRLEIIEAYLSDFEHLDSRSAVPLQPRFTAPKQFHETYYAGDASQPGNKGVVTVNWIVSDTLDRRERLYLRLLDQVLLGTPASPLWKALIDSGLGEDLSAHGLSLVLREVTFSAGLRGIAVEDADKIEALVLQTLEKLAAEGIDKDTVEAALNTIEFRLRENNSGSYPRGLSLMLRTLSTWLHDGDPIAPLGFESTLSSLKADLTKQPRLLETMIRRYLLDNPHRTTVVLEPDETLAAKTEAEEKARLAAVRSGMSAAELDKIIANTRALRQAQTAPDAPEELAKIPRLSLNDLERKHQPIPLEVQHHGETEILFHDLFTSGILYADVGFNLKYVPQRLLPYLGLFGRAMMEMGTETEDFVTLSQRMGKYTGGISSSIVSSLNESRRETDAWMFFWGKTMTSQTGKLLDILHDVLLTPRLDHRERFRQIVLDTKSSRENSLASAGHGVVGARLGACFNASGWFNEMVHGTEYLFFLRELARKVDEDWPAVLSDLQALHQAIIHRGGMICNITLDGESWARLAPQFRDFLDRMPRKEMAPAVWTPELLGGFEGLAIPAQVNFVGKAASLYDAGYQYHGSAVVIQKYLRTGWLWNKIRVQGGAYGAFCSFSKRSGIWGYTSYRDPNLLDTLRNYDESGAYLRENPPNNDELVKSIIGAMGDIDPYQLPDEKGYTSLVRYLFKESDAELQQLRDEVLATGPEHFRKFADMLDHVRDNGLVVVAGSEAALRKANSERPDWLKITKIM